jgi:hypothetical protein
MCDEIAAAAARFRDELVLLVAGDRLRIYEDDLEFLQDIRTPVIEKEEGLRAA